MLYAYYYQQEPKAYLNLYAAYEWKILNCEAEIKEIEDEALRYGINLDGLPKKTSISHPTEEAAFKLLMKRAKYNLERSIYKEVQEDIKDTIKAIPEPMLGALLKLKYIEGKRWKQVAKELHYSQTYVEKELHTKALEYLKIEMQRKLQQAREEVRA